MAMRIDLRLVGEHEGRTCLEGGQGLLVGHVDRHRATPQQPRLVAQVEREMPVDGDAVGRARGELHAVGGQVLP